MPIDASIAAEATAWRRDIHQNPEVLYDVHRTAGLVADRLRSFGCDDVVTGIGRTGVVGVIRGRADRGSETRTLAMRADMDALPIGEQTNLPYASRNEGKMHACGHDGHTAMLLGAAKALCARRDFAGTAVCIFQPAEEGGAGARAMIEDGLMTRFAIDEVYGMHNLPGLADRPIRASARPHDGGGGPVQDRDRGPGRPCGGTPPDRGSVAGRRPYRHDGPEHRGPQRRPARVLRRVGDAVPSRHGAERHPADRQARRNHPELDACDARPRRTALARHRGGRRGGSRRAGHAALYPGLPRHLQPLRARP